ncbi:hypothetical protein CRE_15846 [Caenorhabditis remanei]|uniref:Uncharacterized protein n=1 Tax=Caenorhabditis remanei TaxID=31234 RepID=E3NU50_CAERE|nr:hypothetical protein CRE_15846 [Caenorhabditis remanei]
MRTTTQATPTFSLEHDGRGLKSATQGLGKGPSRCRPEEEESGNLQVAHHTALMEMGPGAWHLGSPPRRPYGLPGGEPGAYVPSGVRERLPIDHQPATAVETAMISQWKDNNKTILLCS